MMLAPENQNQQISGIVVCRIKHKKLNQRQQVEVYLLCNNILLNQFVYFTYFLTLPDYLYFNA